MSVTTTIDTSQAQRELALIARRIEQQYPKEQVGRSVQLVGLQEQLVRYVRPALLALFGAVGFVLLIACANVANLLLARATARQRETAIRTAPILKYQQKFNADAWDEVSLAPFRDKVVVLDFWATWCPPCLQAMPKLDNLQRRFPDRLLVVGVTRLYGEKQDHLDPSAELALVNKAATSHGAHYPIIVDDTDQNDRNYQVEGLPTVVIVGPDGRVRNYLVADDRDVVDDAAREIAKDLAR